MEKFLVFERLNNQNYRHWAFSMKNYLVEKDLWKVVNIAPVKPWNAETARNIERSYALIALGIDVDQQVVIENFNCGFEAWNALHEKHAKGSSAAQMNNFATLLSLKFSEGDDMNAHFTKFKEILNDFKAIGGEISKENAVSMILKSINDVYPSLATAIRAWDEPRLTVNGVTKHIIEEWENLKSHSVAMFVKCGFCHKPGHASNNCDKKKFKTQEYQGGHRGNYRGNYRGSYRGNYRGNFRGNYRGNRRHNSHRQDFSGNPRESANFAYESEDDDETQWANVAARREEKVNSISMKICRKIV